MRSLHILLVEDHSAIAPYIEKTLTADGFHVTLSTGAHSAIRHLGDARWALIILDHVFPSPSGHELVTQIKQICPGVPILALSDHAKKQTEDAMKKANIEHYVLKPFAFQEFLSSVKKLALQHSSQMSELSLDTLTLDTKNHVVRRDSKVITLTKKEYLLLSFLMKHKDQAVPRSDLLEHVWGMQIDPLSNTIEAHILSLRRKIDFAGQTKIIHTVPKFGYRMSVHK